MKPFQHATGEHSYHPHGVTLRPGESLFAARRRWEATKPSGNMSPIFIR